MMLKLERPRIIKIHRLAMVADCFCGHHGLMTNCGNQKAGIIGTVLRMKSPGWQFHKNCGRVPQESYRPIPWCNSCEPILLA
jgi:hypothetical protein